jgi:hypothetical protein
MPHPKKTTVLKRQKMNKVNANASAKSKELQPTHKADALQHICFCPNRTTGKTKLTELN